jgi:hypothetical protein
MTTKRKFVVNIEFEDEDEDEEIPVEDNSLDLYNERLSMMFDGVSFANYLLIWLIISLGRASQPRSLGPIPG